LLKNNKKINQSEDNNSFKINIKNNILKKHLTAQIFFFFFLKRLTVSLFPTPTLAASCRQGHWDDDPAVLCLEYSCWS
jgi:hypothetical protein